MKNVKITATAVLISIISVLAMTGCAALPTGGAKEAAVQNTSAAAASGQVAGGLKKEEISGIQNAVKDYFEKLYAQSIDSYAKNSATGAIPESIRSFIAKRTLSEGDMNPEVGIHFPRYVGINGLTAVSYSVIKAKDDAGAEAPKIEVSCLGKRGDSFLFFTKISLKAGCIPEGIFNADFKQNAATRVYEKVPNAVINDGQKEYIKLQANYDVEVISQDDGYKILSAKESSLVPGVRSRLFVTNNEFVTRIPYLDITKDQAGKAYNNAEDGAVYEKEAAVISAFFENLQNLDDERMSLLRQRWAAGQKEFTNFLVKTGITKDGDSKDLMSIGGDYRNRFDIDSFPLQPNMEKISAVKDFTVTPYISYSSKQKAYTVKFIASVKRINGMIDSENDYKYNYRVYLSGAGDTLKVSDIRLDEYYSLISQ